MSNSYSTTTNNWLNTLEAAVQLRITIWLQDRLSLSLITKSRKLYPIVVLSLQLINSLQDNNFKKFLNA